MDRHEATSYIFRVLSASCPWHPTSLKGLRQQEGWGNRSHQKLPEKFRAFRDKMATSWSGRKVRWLRQRMVFGEWARDEILTALKGDRYKSGKKRWWRVKDWRYQPLATDQLFALENKHSILVILSTSLTNRDLLLGELCLPQAVVVEGRGWRLEGSFSSPPILRTRRTKQRQCKQQWHLTRSRQSELLCKNGTFLKVFPSLTCQCSSSSRISFKCDLMATRRYGSCGP